MPCKHYIFPILILLISSLTTSSQEVGDIKFDRTLDDSSFHLCHKNWIPQYYAVGTTYEGGSDAIRKTFLAKYSSKGVKDLGSQTGYIIIRFVVNCKGATNRFRVYQIDSAYKPFRFDPVISKRLLDITKTLRNWLPGKYKNEKVDSYYYINFKLVRGELKEVLP